MKTTIEWLDAAKARHGLSDYALAPKLGIGRGQMSKYRTGKDFLSDDAAIKLAGLLEVDPQAIIASAHAERAKSDDARRFWERLASVAAGVVMATGLVASPSPARAAPAVSDGGLYIMSNRRKRRGVLRAMADTLSLLSPTTSPLCPT